ncbi:MAG: lactonase family protein [Planctomycetaceae bacterium]
MAVRFALLVLCSSVCLANDVTVWVGTTTPRNGQSKGIYRLTLNAETGKLSKSELAAEVSGPGWVTVSPNGKFLYSTGNKNGASVMAFSIDGDKLKFVNAQPIGDGGAAHLSVNPTGKFLLSAQYGGGSVAVFPLADDGSIQERSQLIEHEGGSGVVGRRQNSPHPHWTGVDAANKFAFVPDLGLDAVVVYRINHEDGTLTSAGLGQCPAGGGPRHMKFHPNGKFAFVLNELALSITMFTYDASTGSMNPLSTFQTLSDDVKAKETFNSAAEIRVHKSGKFVYSSNRGHDSISVFQCDEATGQLTLVEVEPIRGGWPRNFNIDPTGKWLLAAGRDSNTLAVFAIDQKTGELQYTRNLAFVPSPICVSFGK